MADGSTRLRVFVRRSSVPIVERLATSWHTNHTDALNHCITLGAWVHDQTAAGRRVVSLEADGSIAEELQ